MYKTLPLILLFAILPATAQDHVCVDLNGNKTHATVACNKIGMLDEAGTSKEKISKLQCSGLKDSITKLQDSISRQEKLFKTPYSSVKQNALQQQLETKQKQYQSQCVE